MNAIQELYMIVKQKNVITVKVTKSHGYISLTLNRIAETLEVIPPASSLRHLVKGEK